MTSLDSRRYSVGVWRTWVLGSVFVLLTVFRLFEIVARPATVSLWSPGQFETVPGPWLVIELSGLCIGGGLAALTGPKSGLLLGVVGLCGSYVGMVLGGPLVVRSAAFTLGCGLAFPSVLALASAELDHTSPTRGCREAAFLALTWFSALGAIAAVYTAGRYLIHPVVHVSISACTVLLAVALAWFGRHAQQSESVHVPGAMLSARLLLVLLVPFCFSLCWRILRIAEQPPTVWQANLGTTIAVVVGCAALARSRAATPHAALKLAGVLFGLSGVIGLGGALGIVPTVAGVLTPSHFVGLFWIASPVMLSAVMQNAQAWVAVLLAATWFFAHRAGSVAADASVASGVTASSLLMVVGVVFAVVTRFAQRFVLSGTRV